MLELILIISNFINKINHINISKNLKVELIVKMCEALNIIEEEEKNNV
jgi:hypothetical protein